MKKLFIGLLSSICMLTLSSSAIYAGEIDVLLDKLVEKGVLTPVEAQIVADETVADVARQNAAGKNSALPKWVQTVKLKGDVRIRYQNTKADNRVDRNRFRVRYRLGIISKVGKEWEVGAGLATGGIDGNTNNSDPRSTNQTFSDAFSSKAINLDYAYAKYKPNGWFNAIAGKFKRKAYLWNPTDLLWDGDINPEGFSIHADMDGFGSGETFINAGVWMLDEFSSDSNDPLLFYGQVGYKWKEGGYDGKVAATAYSFDNVGSGDAELGADYNGGTNTLTGGNYLYDYNAMALSGEFGVKGEKVGLPFQRVAIFGDYVNNSDPDDHNAGYAAGFKFGHKKVEKKGNWQAKYIYAKLERDAWLDVFPDSDRFGGRTDVKSHELVFSYGLNKNVIAGLDYYTSERISDSTDTEEIIQADLNVKF